MNYKHFALTLILPVALAACNKKPQQESQIDQTSEPTQLAQKADQSTEETFTGSITQLLKQNKNVTCDIEYDASGIISAGTVFVSGEKVRADFTMQSEQGEIESHIINDEEFSWVWSNLLPQGIKTKVSEAEDDGEPIFSQPESDDDSQVDFDGEFDYSCKTWRVDQSKFTPPSDVEFTDLSATIEQIQNNAADLEQLQCAACDQLSGEAKDQCLSALGC